MFPKLLTILATIMTRADELDIALHARLAAMGIPIWRQGVVVFSGLALFVILVFFTSPIILLYLLGGWVDSPTLTNAGFIASTAYFILIVVTFIGLAAWKIRDVRRRHRAIARFAAEHPERNHY